MNKLNSNCVDEVVECPLCMEPLEVDDLNFFPCTCGYQICRFCWHRIRTDENELCPACRKEYPENPADFKPLTQEEMIAFKSQKKQRDQQRKQKVTENRKHLANVRVVQKNLVFVVGLPPRLADSDILKKHEYFGKYGKIHKVVINPSTTYAGIQGPSASAYVTYVHNTDALRAIQSVNNITIDGRLIKTSLGTTKYCSHFMKNQQCPKNDCMYLHELGDAEASFTKEEMHQGKHQEYEKRLHEALINVVQTQPPSSMGGSGKYTTEASITSNGRLPYSIVGVLATSNSSSSNSSSNSGGSSNGLTISSIYTSSHSPIITSTTTLTTSGSHKEAWPSLSVSPVLTQAKEASTITLGNIIQNSIKTRKERNKQEKAKNEKNSRTKQRNNNHNNQHSNNANAQSAVNSSASATAPAGIKEAERTVSTSRSNCSVNEKQQQQQHYQTNSTNNSNNSNGKHNSNNNISSNNSNNNNISNKEEISKAAVAQRDVAEYQTNKNKEKQKQQTSKSTALSATSNRHRSKDLDNSQHADKDDNEENKEEQSDDKEDAIAQDLLSHFRNTINQTHNNAAVMQMSQNERRAEKENSGKVDGSFEMQNKQECGIDETLENGILNFHESENFLYNGEATNTDTIDKILIQKHQKKGIDQSSSSSNQQQQQQQQQLQDNDNKLATETGETTATVTSTTVMDYQHLTDSTNLSMNSVQIGSSEMLENNATRSMLSESCQQLNKDQDNSIKSSDETRNSTAATATTSSNSAFNADIFNIDDFTKLNLFDTNSFFTPSTDTLPNSLLLKSKLANEMLSMQNNTAMSGQLPDLLNGIDGYQSQTIHANDWENAFKNLLPKGNTSGSNSKPQQQIDDKFQQLHLQQQHQHYQQHLQEIQRRNLLLNSLGITQLNGQNIHLQNITNSLLLGNNVNRNSMNLMNHQQQQQQQQQLLQLQQQSLANTATDDSLQNSPFSNTNMSKFFDYHKNQQQKMQNCLNNPGGGIPIANGDSAINNLLYDNAGYLQMLEGSRFNSQVNDATNLLSNSAQGQQQQQENLQKQRLLGKIDQMLCQQQQTHPSPSSGNEGKSNFAANQSTDDDLGFDPFIETQKALAELIKNEDEVIGNRNNSRPISRNNSNIANLSTNKMQQQNQQQLLDYMPRIRMPPPGFGPINNGAVKEGGEPGLGFGGLGSNIMSHMSNGGSKILPFINLNSTNYGSTTASTVTTMTTAGDSLSGVPPGGLQPHQQHTQQPPQQQLPNSIWNSPFGMHTTPPATQLTQQFGTTADMQYNQQIAAAAAAAAAAASASANQTLQTQNRNFGGGDWTAMDPAILSFRQFPGFPSQAAAGTLSAQHLQGVPLVVGQTTSAHQQQQPPNNGSGGGVVPVSSATPNQTHQDMFMQQIAAHHQQQHTGQHGGYQGTVETPTSSASVGSGTQPTNALSHQCLNNNVQGILEYFKTRLV